METVLGWSVAMPWPHPCPHPKWHMPKWMETVLAGIDWKETGALLGVIGTAALILKTLLRPLWERLVYQALAERCTKYDRAAEKVDANADKIEAIEAMVIAQGTVLRDMPRLIGGVEDLSKSVSGLDESIKVMHEDVQGMREWRKYMEGVWDGQERRKGPRRADDG